MHDSANHLLKTLQQYCASRTQRLLTLYQTRENVTKRHACHAKRHHNISQPTRFPNEPQNLRPQKRCEASVNFHHMSQNATPATEFAGCHDAALTMRVAKNTTPHDTSELLRLLHAK